MDSMPDSYYIDFLKWQIKLAAYQLSGWNLKKSINKNLLSILDITCHKFLEVVSCYSIQREHPLYNKVGNKLIDSILRWSIAAGR